MLRTVSIHCMYELYVCAQTHDTNLQMTNKFFIMFAV